MIFPSGLRRHTDTPETAGDAPSAAPRPRPSRRTRGVAATGSTATASASRAKRSSGSRDGVTVIIRPAATSRARQAPSPSTAAPSSMRRPHVGVIGPAAGAAARNTKIPCSAGRWMDGAAPDTVPRTTAVPSPSHSSNAAGQARGLAAAMQVARRTRSPSPPTALESGNSAYRCWWFRSRTACCKLNLAKPPILYYCPAEDSYGCENYDECRDTWNDGDHEEEGVLTKRRPPRKYSSEKVLALRTIIARTYPLRGAMAAKMLGKYGTVVWFAASALCESVEIIRRTTSLLSALPKALDTEHPIDVRLAARC